MAAVLLQVLVFLLGGTVAVVGRWAVRRRSHERVVVVLDTERTIEGVLLVRLPTRLKLGDVFVLGDHGARQAVAGVVWVERRRVEWVQVVR